MNLYSLPGAIFDPLAAHRKMGGGGPPRTLPPTGGPNGPTGPGMPNLYEMAALTTEMDTQAVTTKVKEVLLANNVGQKVIEKLFSIFLDTQKLKIKDIGFLKAV